MLMRTWTCAKIGRNIFATGWFTARVTMNKSEATAYNAELSTRIVHTDVYICILPPSAPLSLSPLLLPGVAVLDLWFSRFAVPIARRIETPCKMSRTDMRPVMRTFRDALIAALASVKCTRLKIELSPCLAAYEISAILAPWY